MKELQVSQQLGMISTNLDAIAKDLKKQMEDYRDYVVTQDSLTSDKKVLADLRKLQKNLEDARKNVKKEWEKPYKEFEAKYKTVLALVDEPIELIDTQVKMFESEQRGEKLEHVKELYSEEIGEYEPFLPFEKVFREQWLNKTTTDKDIKYDLSEAKVKVKSDLDIIHGLGSEIEEELLELYRNNDNSLSVAIKRNSDYVSDKIKIQSKPKLESESLGSLNDLTEMVRTAHIIISLSDLQAAKNALDFNEIKYQVLEGK